MSTLKVMPSVQAAARWSGETFTQQWQSALENVALDHEKFLQECQTYENDLMPQAYADLKHAFRDTEAGKLPVVAADAYKGRADLADQKVQGILDQLASFADDPAAGSKSVRVRDRLQRALDKATPGEVASVVAKAVADAPDRDIPALVAETPSMLEAAGVPLKLKGEEITGADLMKLVLAQRVPELAAAMEEQRRAEMSRQCIAQNADRLQKCIYNAEPLRAPLVDPNALKSGSCDPDLTHVA